MESKLKITEEIRQELTEKSIIICTHILADETEVDCIDMFYQDQYPDLEIVEVKASAFTIPE
jgi:hypothetical protein